MADDKKKNNLPEEEEDMEEIETYTLTDENGDEAEFELIGEAELDGVTYYAMQELDENLEPVGDEYVILRLEVDEDGEEYLVSVDDDEEFDRVADYFDDEFSDIDYDE